MKGMELALIPMGGWRGIAIAPIDRVTLVTRP